MGSLWAKWAAWYVRKAAAKFKPHMLGSHPALLLLGVAASGVAEAAYISAGFRHTCVVLRPQ